MSRPPMMKMFAVFLATLILGQFVLAAIVHFFPDLNLPSSIGILILAVASMSAGQVFARGVGRKMTTGEKARFAMIATLLGLLLAFGTIWAQFVAAGAPLTVDNAFLGILGEIPPQNEIRMFLLVGGAVAVLSSLLVCFFGVGFGASSQVRQAERLANKGK